ncbi:hypothetical protein [Candidatus Nitrosocosmicus sp. T]
MSVLSNLQNSCSTQLLWTMISTGLSISKTLSPYQFLPLQKKEMSDRENYAIHKEGQNIWMSAFPCKLKNCKQKHVGR